jgi:hypothetical protein
MLAEIFMLKLEAASRALNPPAPTSSAARFVPIDAVPIQAEPGRRQAEKSTSDQS